MSRIKIFLIAISIFYGSCSDMNSNEESNNKYSEEKEMNTMINREVVEENQNKFYLKFENDLNAIKAGEKFNLVFTPILKENKSVPLTLESIHERKAHLIIVGEDLEYFNHIHPEKESNGIYSVETSLLYGGEYKLFIEYKPAGYEKVTEVVGINVAGNNKPEKIYQSQNTFFNGNEYSIKLLNPENLIAGKESSITVEFRRDGQIINVDELENYLGEKAHAVAISLDDKNFAHIHPMVMDDKLNLHLNLDKSGLYRLWIQFKINGKVNTADFVINVNHSEKNETKNNQHKHH